MANKLITNPHKIRIWLGSEFAKLDDIHDITNASGKLEAVLGWYPPIELHTGLQDNDGNDIYEGDIFNITYSNIPDGFSMMNGEKEIEEVKGVVVMESGCYVVKHIHPKTNKETYMLLYKLLENPEKVIIGNKYENPDMLDKKLQD